MKYIEEEKRKEGCAFCDALGQTDGPENLIVHRGQHAFLILNRYPYTSGHLMVLPFLHVPGLSDLDADTRAEMMEVLNKGILSLEEIYKPQGFNLGANIGEAAGAGIEEHVHLHIVPRWKGDTNFMSSVGGTRVLPEELEETYRRVRETWETGI
jgi:ATP adenylyltransferase